MLKLEKSNNGCNDEYKNILINNIKELIKHYTWSYDYD